MLGTTKDKGFISEEDTSLLLQRYNATTILALLHEVSQFAGVKIDWKTLTKKSSTGISNAREYQMLWRHLAYRGPLLEKVDGAEPLDDDSDLEFELEAVPAVSSEASSEAAACVKVLMSSGATDRTQLNRSTLEAPLMINIPRGQTLSTQSDEQLKPCSSRGTNITIPVSIPKPSQPQGSSMETLDGNVSVGSAMPAKKRRKVWTKEEDMKLIAAVQKYGEGNWANILKEEFQHDRTAAQLSQRWSTLRKRLGNLTTGNGSNPVGGTQSEAMLATRNAVSMALNMPTFGSLSAICSGPTQSSTPSASLATPAILPETAPLSAPPAVNQSQPTPSPAVPQRGPSVSSAKSRTSKKSCNTEKPAVGPNQIKAAAFAAGGRMATPSAAASLFRAAMSKNAVHIRPGGTALPKSSVKTAKLPSTTNTSGSQPPSLHNSRPVAMPPPQCATKLGSQHGQESSGKQATQPPQASCASPADSLSLQMAGESKTEPATCASANGKTEERSGNEVSMVDSMEVDDVEAQGQEATLVSNEVNSRTGSDDDAGPGQAGNDVDPAGGNADPIDTNVDVANDVEVAQTNTDMDIDHGTKCENAPKEQSDSTAATNNGGKEACDVAEQ